MENQPQPASDPQLELQEPEVPNVAMSISDHKMRDASTGQFASPEVWNQYENSKANYDTQVAANSEAAQKEAEDRKAIMEPEVPNVAMSISDHKMRDASTGRFVSPEVWNQYEKGKAAREPKPLTAAEQRQSEYAALLKAHDKELLAAATRVAERKEAEKAAEQGVVSAAELTAVTPEPGNDLVLAPRAELATISGKELVPTVSSKSDNLPVLWKAPGELAVIESGEPVDQGGWLRRGFSRAKNAIMLAPVNIPRRVGEWARQHFSKEDENGERQVRWGKAAVAVGGLAVAVAGVYVASKGFGNGGEAVAAGPQPGSGSGAGGEVTAQALGWTDTIKPGDGLTNSIMDYAHQNGIADINPQRAFDIFNQLTAEHLIDSAHVTGSAPMDVMGNIGYAAPGQSVWSAETVARMHELLGLH